MKRIPRCIFTAEFKREAIKLVTEQGLTPAEAGRKLDIATKSLRTWMDQQERGKLKSSLDLVGVSVRLSLALYSLTGSNGYARCTAFAAHIIKKFRITTDSKHNLLGAPNLPDRQFVRTAPNQVWMADITDIQPTRVGYFRQRSKICTPVKSSAGRWIAA